MARTRNPGASQAPLDRHAAYAALMARLKAFQTEITAQAKSRAATEAPVATGVMAADLMTQIARLMQHAVERRGLPQLTAGHPATFSEIAVAFVQAHHAFEAFGKRRGFDQPIADAESERRWEEQRNELVHMFNNRIIDGIREVHLIPTDGEHDPEKTELTKQLKTLLDRLDQIVDAEASGLPLRPSGQARG